MEKLKSLDRVPDEFLHLLVCPSCRRPALDLRRPTHFHRFNPAVGSELVCESCRSLFPVVDGIPVLFSDSRQVTFAIDAASKTKAVREIADLSKRYVASHSPQRLRLGADADREKVAWEYFLWGGWGERRAETDLPSDDRERIERHLQTTRAVGGRLRFLDDIERHEGVLDGKLLLNVGCGTDPLLGRMSEKGCRVIEQDIVLDALPGLKKRGATFCLCCDLAELPLAGESVDIVTSSGVVHHVWPIEKTLTHVMRVLKPGGGAYLVEPNAFALTTVMKALVPRWLRRLLRKLQHEPVSPSPFEKSIDPFAMARLLRKCGARRRGLVRSFRGDIWGSPPHAIAFVLKRIVALFPFLSAHCFTAARKRSRE